MKLILALATTAAASLLARDPRYARDLLLPLEGRATGRIDRNTADYYIGYRGSDFEKPWANYFNASPIALNEEFLEGLEVPTLNILHIQNMVADIKLVEISRLARAWDPFQGCWEGVEPARVSASRERLYDVG